MLPRLREWWFFCLASLRKFFYCLLFVYKLVFLRWKVIFSSSKFPYIFPWERQAETWIKQGKVATVTHKRKSQPGNVSANVLFGVLSPSGSLFCKIHLYPSDRGSLCSPDQPETQYVDQAGFILRNSPTSVYWMLGFKTCATTPCLFCDVF